MTHREKVLRMPGKVVGKWTSLITVGKRCIGRKPYDKLM
jgi:hypothetical protein